MNWIVFAHWAGGMMAAGFLALIGFVAAQDQGGKSRRVCWYALGIILFVALVAGLWVGQRTDPMAMLITGDPAHDATVVAFVKATREALR